MGTKRLFVDKPTAILEGYSAWILMNSFTQSFYSEVYKRHKY